MPHRLPPEPPVIDCSIFIGLQCRRAILFLHESVMAGHPLNFSIHDPENFKVNAAERSEKPPQQGGFLS